MASRVVTGTFLRSDNTPFQGYEVWYTLKPGGFSATTNYPRNRVTAIVGANGRQHPRNAPNFNGIELWISEEAADRTEYRCQLPDGNIVEFELDAGVGSIDISTLMLQGSPYEPLDPSDIVTEELEDLLAAHNNDPFAHPFNAQSEQITTLDGNFAVWTLPDIPAFPQLSRFFVNGTKAIYAVDYVINGLMIEWRSLDLSLEPTDTVEFYYR